MPPKKNKAEQNLMERKKDAMVAWFSRRKPETMNIIEVAIQNDWTADKSLKPGGKMKDLLKELIEDGRVQQKKCGVATVFYTFPSTELVKTIDKIKTTAQELEDNKAVLEKLKQEYREAVVGKEDSYDRQTYILQIEHFKQKNAEAQAKINQYSDNDPEFIKSLEGRLRLMVESINITTENIFMIGKLLNGIGAYSQLPSLDAILKEASDGQYRSTDDLDYILLPPELIPKGDDLNGVDGAMCDEPISPKTQKQRRRLRHQSHGLIYQRPKPIILPSARTWIHPSLFLPWDKDNNMGDETMREGSITSTGTVNPVHLSMKEQHSSIKEQDPPNSIIESSNTMNDVDENPYKQTVHNANQENNDDDDDEENKLTNLNQQKAFIKASVGRVPPINQPQIIKSVHPTLDNNMVQHQQPVQQQKQPQQQPQQPNATTVPPTGQPTVIRRVVKKRIIVAQPGNVPPSVSESNQQ